MAKNPKKELLPEHIRKSIDKEIKQAKMKQEIEHDLQTNPHYKKFFKQYSKHDVECFINRYPFKKVMYLSHGPWYKKNEEAITLKYINMAKEKIWEIQQKKLFNLQCQWRAEQIEIPGISVTYDFRYWEDHIQNCSFLNHVDEEDIELYIQYILSIDKDYFSPYNWISSKGLLSWQDYKEFKNQYQSQDDNFAGIIPDWYEFYDNRRGTGSLMLLPDIRGKKEQFYSKLAYEDEVAKQKTEGTYKEYIPTQSKPPLRYYDQEDLENFIIKFESKELLSLCRAYEEFHRKRTGDEDEELERVIQTLIDAKEQCYIEAHYDWWEGVLNAALDYEKRQLGSALNKVYEQYLKNPQSVIAHEENSGGITFGKKQLQYCINRIIKGRALNGEPPDLNF